MKAYRWISLLCLLCMALPLLVACGHQHTPGAWEEVTAPDYGTEGLRQRVCTTCGDVLDTERTPAFSEHLAYNAPVYPDMTCGIRGRGTCTDTALSIPAEIDGYPVSYLNKEAFLGNHFIEEVYIPATVSLVGERAFADCAKLTHVTFAGEVKYISSNAFDNCPNLVYTQFDNGLYLGNKSNPYLILMKPINDEITSCVVHQDTKVMAKGVFATCKSLTDLTVMGGTVGRELFYIYDLETWGTHISSVTLGDKVTALDYGAFLGCGKLTNIKLPASLTEIGGYAFWYCSGLTHLLLPDGVTEIGAGTFGMCTSLSSITIGGDVTKIGDEAFIGCKSLSAIYFGGTLAEWEAIEKGQLWNAGILTCTIYCTDGELAVNP